MNLKISKIADSYSVDRFVLEVTLAALESICDTVLESGRVSVELASGSLAFELISGSSSCTSFMISVDDRPSLDGLLFSSSFDGTFNGTFDVTGRLSLPLGSVDETVRCESTDVVR